MPEVGTYVLPVIASFEGIDAQVNKTLGSKFGVAGKKAGTDFTKNFADGVKAQERVVEAARNKLTDATGKAAVAEKRLQELRKAGAKDSQILNAENNLTKARRTVEQQTRATSEAQKDLETAQKNGSSSSLLNADAMGKMGAVAGGVAAAGILALAAGAVTAVKSLYDLGAQFDDLNDNMRVTTGLSGAALDGLVKSAENISKTVPLGLGDIGKIAADTNRALHLTGPALEDVAGNIANLGRLTGENVNIQTLGKAFRSFGVDAKDQVPALDSLLQANQKTGLSVNTMLDSVVKGGAVLREFGFDLGQSAGLIGTFEAAGLDGDKALASMTKGLAAFAKAGKDPKKALQDTTTEIQRLINTGNDSAALDLTNKIFGAKGGINFFDAIKSGSLDLQALSNSVTGTGDTIAAAAQDTDDWAEKWQTFKNKAAVALQPVASSVFDQVNTSLEDLSTWVEAHPDEIINFFQTIGDGAILAGQTIINSVGIIAQGLAGVVNAIGDTYGATTRATAAVQRLLGNNERADQLDREADAAFGWADGLYKIADEAKAASATVGGFHTVLDAAADSARKAAGGVQTLDGAVGQLSGKSINVPIKVDVPKADQDMQVFFNKWSTAVINPKIAVPGSSSVPPSGPQNPLLAPYGRAGGGAITGPGGPTSDVIPIWASNGEFVVRAAAARKNMPLLEMINAGRYAAGGVVGPDVDAAKRLAGTPYSQGSRFDCSGTVARVINAALGTGGGLMTTKTASEWLAARGFVNGLGGPGMISVGWYDHGPNPNDGHMAMTLSDGSNAESGGKNKTFTIGANASGANSPQFDHHMYLPTAFGKGAAPAPGAAAAPVTSDGKPAQPVGGEGKSTGSTGGGSLPSSLSGLSSFGLDDLGSGIGKTGSGSDLGLFGKAAGSAVSGQVSSALGVFGVNDSPGWLNAATKLVGGIKVSGKDGTPIFDGANPLGSVFGQGSSGSAAPLSAKSTATGAAPPDGMEHGTRAGQQPGPQTVVNYNIRTAVPEDAFLAAQRKQNVRLASKMDRY